MKPRVEPLPATCRRCGARVRLMWEPLRWAPDDARHLTHFMFAETTEPATGNQLVAGTVSEVGREAAASLPRSGSGGCDLTIPSLPAPSSESGGLRWR